MKTNQTDLRAALIEAYEAMMVMRAMLAKCDVSLTGGSLNATIEKTGMLLYPPSEEAMRKAAVNL